MVTLSRSALEFQCFFLIWPPSYVESIETQERSDCLTTWALSPFFRVSPCRRRKRVIFQKTSGIFSWGQCEKTKGTKRKRKEEGRESRSTCETIHVCIILASQTLCSSLKILFLCLSQVLYSVHSLTLVCARKYYYLLNQFKHPKR